MVNKSIIIKSFYIKDLLTSNLVLKLAGSYSLFSLISCQFFSKDKEVLFF